MNAYETQGCMASFPPQPHRPTGKKEGGTKQDRVFQALAKQDPKEPSLRRLRAINSVHIEGSPGSTPGDLLETAYLIAAPSLVGPQHAPDETRPNESADGCVVTVLKQRARRRTTWEGLT